MLFPRPNTPKLCYDHGYFGANACAMALYDLACKAVDGKFPTERFVLMNHHTVNDTVFGTAAVRCMSIDGVMKFRLSDGGGEHSIGVADPSSAVEIALAAANLTAILAGMGGEIYREAA